MAAAVYREPVEEEGPPFGMMTIVEAVAVGMLVMLAGTLPRNALFAANLQILPRVPWAVPAVAIYLVAFCWYLDGHGAPADTQAYRRSGLRANRVTGVVWFWSLATGVAGIFALVLALRVANQILSRGSWKKPRFAAICRGRSNQGRACPPPSSSQGQCLPWRTWTSRRSSGPTT